MIKPFKFLSGVKSMLDMYGREINPNHYQTISLTGNLRFLKEYHRRLDCIYMSHYNMFNDRHPLYNQYSDMVYGVFEPWEMGGATNQEILVDTYNFINPRR